MASTAIKMTTSMLLVSSVSATPVSPSASVVHTTGTSYMVITLGSGTYLLTITMHTYSQPGPTVCGGIGDSQLLAGAGTTLGIAHGTPLGMVAGVGAHGVMAGTAAGIALGTLAGMVAGMLVGIAHTMVITMAGVATTIVLQTTPSVVSLDHVATIQT